MKTIQKVEPITSPTFIKVSQVDEGGIIRAIEYGYEVYCSEKKQEDEYFHYYIPGFNIYFFAKTQEDAKRKGDAAMVGFFNYWVKNQGKKAFLDELNRLGFEEKKVKLVRNYKLPKNRPSVPAAYSHRAFNVSHKTAA